MNTPNWRETLNRPIKLPRLRFPRSRRAIALLLSPFLAAMLVGAWQARPFNAAREYPAPVAQIPSPNAHDFYVKAYQSIRSQPVSPILDSYTTAEEREKTNYPLAAKQRWLQDNQKGFAIFEEAQKQAYWLPPNLGDATGIAEANLYEMRWLARYKTVEIEVLGAQKQSEKAVNKALDLWKMGLDMGNGAHLIPALGGIAVEAMARKALNSEITHLNGLEAARAAQRLEKLLPTRVPVADVWKRERVDFLSKLPKAFAEGAYNQWRDAEFERRYARDEEMPPYKVPEPSPLNFRLNWQIRQQAQQLARGYNFLIADAPASWHNRQKKLPEFLGPNPKVASLMSKSSGSRFFFARAETQGNLFLARLALHAFRKDTGAYPEKLGELAPKYLENAPLDPLSDGQILRYRRDGNRYKLWSIGPDERDDGGKPAENPAAKRPSSRYFVTEEMSGDIVANIND
ncbi:MAG TPA: hypothetical protein VGB45_13185 [Abditibacterium sp.]|jgi:hypothetical protein